MNILRLEKEIQNQKASLITAVDNRKHHPSFGYTKRDILETLHIMEGMIISWLYVTGAWDNPAAVNDTAVREIARTHFGMDLRNLRALAQSA